VDQRRTLDHFSDAQADELGSPFVASEQFVERESEQRVRTFRVVDGADKKLVDTAYSLHQGNRTHTGVLNASGEGAFGSVDPNRPFRLHVADRVCAIVEGAILLVDDPAVEYGGQFVDWRLADAANADTAFWRQYSTERKADNAGPQRFWQHDHIMRRPIKLRSSFAAAAKPPTFQAVPVQIRLGPMVRFTNESCALVWVELETPGLVRVRYRKADDQVGVPRAGKALRESEMKSRHAATVRVGGRHFVLVKLDELQSDTVYQYTLDLAPLPAIDGIDEATFPQSLAQSVQASHERQLAGASFRKDRWLLLRTLAKDYRQLRFAHGSCRKWPGDADSNGKSPGPDMLALFGSDWMAKQQVLSEWPRFFLHTGDQIYADDIGIKHGERIVSQRFGSIVPGPRLNSTLEDGAWAGRFADRYVAIDGKRAATLSAPTQALRERMKQIEPLLIKARKDGRVDRETIKLEREYQAAYKAVAQQPAFQRADSFIDPKRPLRFKQRVENALLWNVPYDKSESPEVSLTGLRHRDRARSYYPSAGDTNAVHAADFAEYSYLYERAWSIDGARKTLAHLPSFMIFDDHEITDDWNFHSKWVDIVFGNGDDPYDMWPKTITDGLAAYWMYQGWGNLPPDVWAADPRIQILTRARASGKDALPELRKLILARASKPAKPGVDAKQRLTWYYPLPIRSPRFLVVDDRSEREVYGAGGPFQKQLQWLQGELDKAKGSAAFIVFPTPFLLPHPLSWAMKHRKATRNINFLYKLIRKQKWDWQTIDKLARDSDMEHAAGNRVWEQILKILTKIQDSVTPLKTIAFVSGDIHFSCNIDAQLKKFDPPPQPHLLQLVSSGLRQTVSTSKQSELRMAYSLFGFDITGTHRDLSMRLGGLDGSGRDDPNFLFATSVALVDVDLRDKGGDPRIQGMEIPNVDIRQQHLIYNNGKIESYDFRYANNERTGPKLLTPGRKN